MSWVISPSLASLPVLGSTARFPVTRVLCIGRNYAEHAREMGVDPSAEGPLWFTKAPTCVHDASAQPQVAFPPLTSDLQHEVELAVAMRSGGANLSADTALDHVFGYAVALDLTRRDLQAAAKRGGKPWASAKTFDHAAPVGTITPASAGHPSTGRIWCEVDGHRCQDGDLADMIWGVPALLAHLSRSLTLMPGDLILTGTPAGVGPITPGQRVTTGIHGLQGFDLTIG